nr:Asp23/Gls24 family envelope stress response protein [Frankia sp. CpI1-P]
MGRTSIADVVVRKIAGVAAREVAGVHKLGTGGARAVASVKARIPGASASVAQGVVVEVGQRQAAVDLDVVCDYGVSIVDLSQSIRRNVVSSVEGMTGLEVTEVNVAVDDVYIAEDSQEETRRVE